MQQKVIIIAEAGVNHNGDLQRAKQLVVAAANAGADYVKFQTFKAENLVTRSASKATYQQKNTGNDDSQFAMLKQLELSEDYHLELIKTCKQNNIKFLSTGFDLESLSWLNNLDMDFFKIPSGEITNYPYLRLICKFGKPVVLSTGMSSLEEIGIALRVLLTNGILKEEITVLHCNTEYPTPMQDVNLRAMQTIANAYNVKVGYSDHTEGIEVPIAAVAMGAVCIEKHFTMDRNLPGPDHIASLEPNELKAMVTAIRNIEKALGSSLKEPSPSELKNISVARKSIVASIDIKKGDVFSELNITTKRPGTGINPMLWNEVLGRTAPRDFSFDEIIDL